MTKMKTKLFAALIATFAVTVTGLAIDVDHFEKLDAAPEVLKVDIVKVERDGARDGDFTPMVYTAKVLQVDRTAQGVKVGDLIKIRHSYIHTKAQYTGSHLTAPLNKGQRFVRLQGQKGNYRPVSGADGLHAKGLGGKEKVEEKKGE